MSKVEALSKFEDQFCRNHGTIKEFLDEAICELEKDGVIAIKHKAYPKSISNRSWLNMPILNQGRTILDIYICDGEAAQWYL